MSDIKEDLKQFIEFSMEMTKHTNSLSSLAVDGLEAIAKIVGGSTADTAVEALEAIRAVMGVLGNGLSGRVTPDDARKALAALDPGLAQNDAKADAALAARFDDGAP